MKIDSCLILSAGLGTRMGPIGKILPKPLWPLFEKKLIDLQINFAKNLGVERIYVNGHHCHAQLKDFIDLFNRQNAAKVTFLYEPILLGSGGGVHNVARIEKYQGTLLYLAVDQFYFFDQAYFELTKDLINTHDAVLFGLVVDKPGLYNRLVIQNNILNRIEGPDSSSQVTFSGMGLINLKKLTPNQGVSSFFESIANYNKQSIYILTPQNAEYWDFGTSENYFNSCFRLLSEKNSRFLEFCKKEDVMRPYRDSNSYGLLTSKNLINLSTKRVDNPKAQRAIVLDQKDDLLEIKFPGLFFNDTAERLLC